MTRESLRFRFKLDQIRQLPVERRRFFHVNGQELYVLSAGGLQDDVEVMLERRTTLPLTLRYTSALSLLEHEIYPLSRREGNHVG